MLADLIGKIKDLLSLSARQVLIIAVATWLLLLLPDSLLVILGLADLRGQLRPWIGLIALLSIAWLVTLPLYRTGEFVHKQFLDWRFQRGGRRLLENLSPIEKAYLQEYVANDVSTRTFRYSDGVAQGLEAKGILYRASQLSKAYPDYFDYNIQPWAYHALKSDPSLLVGAARPQDRRRGRG